MSSKGKGRGNVGGLEKELRSLSKKVSKLENFHGSMVSLPSAPPQYYRGSSKYFTRLLLKGLDSEAVTYDPYKMLNDNPSNSALLLEFATVQFHHIDVFLTDTKFAIVRFYDTKAIQSTQSGNPILEGYGNSDLSRFEVFPVGATGSVTAKRIFFPKLIEEKIFDVQDKVTPLFSISGSDSEAKGYVFVACTLHGFSYLKPSVPLSEGQRRHETGLIFKTE